MASATNWKKTRNYLMTLRFSISQANGIMKRYGKLIDMPGPCPKEMKDVKYHREYKKHLYEVADKIQGDWNAFMHFYHSVKDKYKVRKLKVSYKRKISKNDDNEEHWR